MRPGISAQRRKDTPMAAGADRCAGGCRNGDAGRRRTVYSQPDFAAAKCRWVLTRTTSRPSRSLCLAGAIDDPLSAQEFLGATAGAGSCASRSDGDFRLLASARLATARTSIHFRWKESPSQRWSPFADINSVLPGYFDTMRIPLLSGRVLDARDAEKPVTVIDETLARRFFAGENPIGRTDSRALGRV